MFNVTGSLHGDVSLQNPRESLCDPDVCFVVSRHLHPVSRQSDGEPEGKQSGKSPLVVFSVYNKYG